MKLPKPKSKGEETLNLQLMSHKMKFEREFVFAPPRRFRADFAFPQKSLLVEVEGGIWMKKSRHTGAKGYQADMEKYNLAAKLGYTVLRFTTQQVVSGMAILQIRDVLGLK